MDLLLQRKSWRSTYSFVVPVSSPEEADRIRRDIHLILHPEQRPAFPRKLIVRREPGEDTSKTYPQPEVRASKRNRLSLNSKDEDEEEEGDGEMNDPRSPARIRTMKRRQSLAQNTSRAATVPVLVPVPVPALAAATASGPSPAPAAVRKQLKEWAKQRTMRPRTTLHPTLSEAMISHLRGESSNQFLFESFRSSSRGYNKAKYYVLGLLKEMVAGRSRGRTQAEEHVVAEMNARLHNEWGWEEEVSPRALRRAQRVVCFLRDWPRFYTIHDCSVHWIEQYGEATGNLLTDDSELASFYAQV